MPLTISPGATNRIDNRVTRRSKGARCRFRLLVVEGLLMPWLEPILFHPPIQSAAAQTESLCRLADVALKALQRLADQDTFNRFQTQFFEVLPLSTLRTEPKISWLDLFCAAHEHCPLHGVFQFANISRPSVLKKRLQCCRLDPLHW